EARFGADCLAHAPDLVTIYVGVNDAWHRYTRGEHIDDADFAQGYRHLLDQLAATVPGAQVLMIVPFVADIDAQTAQIHEDLDGKVAIIRRLAAEHGHRLVDLELMLATALARNPRRPVGRTGRRRGRRPAADGPPGSAPTPRAGAPWRSRPPPRSAAAAVVLARSRGRRASGRYPVPAVPEQRGGTEMPPEGLI